MQDSVARPVVPYQHAKPFIPRRHSCEFLVYAAVVMDAATCDALLEERENLSKRLGVQERSAAKELQMALPDWRRPAAGLGEKFISLASATRQRFSQSALDINKFLVVELA